MNNPKNIDKEKLTKKEYESLTPYEKGYASYFQSKWNPEVVEEKCPFENGSKDFTDWHTGQSIAVRDLEDRIQKNS